MGGKVRDRLMDAALTAMISGAVALAAASGFSTPKAKLDDHEARITAVEKEVGGVDVPSVKTNVAVLQTDVKYIRQGVDKLLGYQKQDDQ